MDSARILIVDDDPDVRTYLSRLLEREGYQSEISEGGADALARVARDPPDLILLDVGMVGIDGFAVCRQLKADERTALIPITFLTGGDERVDRQTAIEAGADDFLTKPIDPSMLRARLRTQLRIKRLTDQLESTENVIFSMARWVEFKNPYTEGHLRRISAYGECLGNRIGLSASDLRTLRHAGILHDIGKIGVRQDILDKPGKLTKEEEDELRLHCEHGATIIAPLRFAADVGPVIMAHHEFWNGKGYPQGLSGENIPLAARIISVVDAFDAMTTDRPYRSAIPLNEVIRRLRAGSGTQFEPRLVDAFIDLLTEGELPIGDLGIGHSEIGKSGHGQSTLVR